MRRLDCSLTSICRSGMTAMEEQPITPEGTMGPRWMRGAFLASDHTMEQRGHRGDARAQAPDSDAITVAAAPPPAFRTITSGHRA